MIHIHLKWASKMSINDSSGIASSLHPYPTNRWHQYRGTLTSDGKRTTGDPPLHTPLHTYRELGQTATSSDDNMLLLLSTIEDGIPALLPQRISLQQRRRCDIQEQAAHQGTASMISKAESSAWHHTGHPSHSHKLLALQPIASPHTTNPRGIPLPMYLCRLLSLPRLQLSCHRG